MTTQEKQVAIELQTVIYDNGDQESNTTQAVGMFYQSPTKDVLMYEETIEDGFTVKNMLTLHDDKVSVKRTGPIMMHQQFRKHKVTENVYKHPHGNIHMETFTQSINYHRPTETENGQLTIDYTVKLNGADERYHQLTLWIRSKEEVQ